jgi:hypothetical protein
MVRVSKEDGRRRREEEREEELKQAIADIETLKSNGNWRVDVLPNGLSFVTGGTDIEPPRPETRHERMKTTDAFNRLNALGRTDGGRETVRKAIEVVDMKGAAYDV